jgi:D-amino peptidase
MLSAAPGRSTGTHGVPRLAVRSAAPSRLASAPGRILVRVIRTVHRSAYALVSVLLVIAALTSAAPAAAQARKIYISVDMEGISGISGGDQVSASGAEYGRSRKLMAEDLNAAIRGALEAGATDILVNDSHGGQRNLLPEDIHPSARLISHSFKRHGMMEGLDDSFDGVIFIGYHAKAGAPRGLFAHTGSDVVRDLQINGHSVGEGGMNAALAAWYGVPVLMVSGDDVAVAEVKESAPGAVGVVVKRAINTRAVELVPLQRARQEIQRAARESVGAPKDIAPQRTGPYRVQMRFANLAFPEVLSALKEVELIGPDTVAFSRETMPDAYRLIRVFYRFITVD